MTSIPELEEQKAKVHQVFSKADAALHTGKISQAEHDALLRSYYNTTAEREATAAIEAEMSQARQTQSGAGQTVALVSGFSALMVALFAVLFYSTGGITGAVVLDHELNTTYFANTSIPVELVGATRVNITGAIIGQGNATIILLENGQEHILFVHSSGARTPHAAMERTRHYEGETVSFNATNVSAAYLMTAAEALPLDPDSTTLHNLTAGEYALKLIINDSELTQEILEFRVVAAGTPEEPAAFNTCGTLCTTNLTTNATIELRIDGNLTMTIGSIIVTTAANRPPELARPIPDITGTGMARVDISAAFHDPDGDALHYDHAHNEGMEESLEDGVLTVTGEPGTYTYTVYASDLSDLTPSNIFSITILAAPNATDAVANETNATGNATTEIPATTNTTANVTLNDTQNGSAQESNTTGPIVTTNQTTGCDDPDPNKRPLSCIQANDTTYFRPETIPLENKQATQVGQLTPVGNLLIRGDLIEHSVGQPDMWDYQLGYTDPNGDFVPTLWIDSATGDLHLRGQLTEANGNIPQREGYSALINQRGIILALIDGRTGDLILRGNLVPYRRSFG